MVTIERTYAPGVCNISPEEEARRLAFGWVGVAVTIALAAALWLTGVPAPWRLTLFIPATLAATGFLQAGLHFCAGYGMKGVFNVGSEVGKVQNVEQEEFAKKDRAKAQLIFALSLAIGAVVGVGSALLP
jgi:hypothetical protein